MLDRPEDDAWRWGDAPARPAATLVRLSSSRPAAAHGDPVALRAQVCVPAGGLPTGRVLFRAAGRPLGSAVVDASGLAVLEGVLLPPGLHAVTASYAGDDRHAAATSPPLPQAVAAEAEPVVVLVRAPAPEPDGVRLEAELVDPRTGRLAEAASGCVVFTAGRAVLARAELVAGSARALVERLPPGRLRAVFAGDTEHAPASGSYVGPGDRPGRARA